MLTRLPASLGLLFGSFLYHEKQASYENLRSVWEETYGPSFSFAPQLNPLKKYYSSEMGDEESLKRFFVLTETTYPRDELLQSKLQAIKWEQEWAHDSKRSVNVDVGFLTAENFILATTKNFSHRIFIGEGIFADLTYHFHLGKFETLPWTYPDYSDSEKMEFFTWGRSYLLNKSTHSKK